MATPPEIARRALPLVDLTNLNEDCTAADVLALCEAAATPHGPVAAICIYPRWVAYARAMLKHPDIKIATVANFPEGAADEIAAIRTTAQALEDGADEVDVVMPWRTFLAGDEQAAANLIAACRAVTPQGKTLKVILETGELKDAKDILNAANLALDAGADFLKTSTGKVPVNATPEAAEILLEAIRVSGRPAGFKASGGIRTVEDAGLYLDIADRIMGPGWVTPKTFRFGASSLLGNLLAAIDAESAPPASSG
jgi:deoxyribose-phosphate aldolase